MKGREFLIVVSVLAALLVLGCQRSANPPVYEVEIQVTLADGYWGEPPPVVEVTILEYVPGMELLVSSERVYWIEGQDSAVSFQWVPEGHYTVHIEASRATDGGGFEIIAAGAKGMDVPADRTVVAIHRVK